MIGLFKKVFKGRDNGPRQLSEYEKRLQGFPPELRAQLEMGPQIDTIPNASGRFGHDLSNPIPVCLQQGELEYLACLRCGCGEPFMFYRSGSCGDGPDGHVVDRYELVCRLSVHEATLYLDMYHKGPSSRVPDGMTKGPAEGIGLPYHINDSPDGLLRAIQAAAKRAQGGDNRR